MALIQDGVNNEAEKFGIKIVDVRIKRADLPPANSEAIYSEYINAKEVTQERMYLETMEKVLADIDKVIIEKNAGSGVVPYLPLPELKKKATN